MGKSLDTFIHASNAPSRKKICLDVKKLKIVDTYRYIKENVSIETQIVTCMAIHV